MPVDNSIVVDSERLRTVLSEKGLPNKVSANLSKVEFQVHAIVCSGLDFNLGFAELEIPDHVLAQLRKEFRKVWMIQRKPVKATAGKSFVLFALQDEAVKMVVRTAINKDRGIFEGKTNKVRLHETWAKYLRKNPTVASKDANLDWSEAERAATRFNQQTVKQINDGKTFNAQKDNPWARKNLKKKTEN